MGTDNNPVVVKCNRYLERLEKSKTILESSDITDDVIQYSLAKIYSQREGEGGVLKHSALPR